MNDTVRRSIFAKRVRFRSRDKKFKPDALQDLLRAVEQKAPNLVDHHYPVPPPPPGKLKEGTQCHFIRNIRRRHGYGDSEGLYFEVATYVLGHPVDQASLDFAMAEATIEHGPLLDGNGKPKEILYFHRCVALGETLLVESQRGAGGLADLGRYLSYLFRRYGKQGTPSVELLDVASASLRSDIERGGGATGIRLRMVDASVESIQDDAYATPLYETQKKIKGANKLGVEWSTDNGLLDIEDVLTAVDEYKTDGSPFDSVRIELKNGAPITRLGKYRLRSPLDVTISGGVIYHTEIIQGLWSYLDELRTGDGTTRIINDEGLFSSATAVTLQS